LEIREVQIADVLRARDARAALQDTLIARYRVPVVSFSMNIAGRIKLDAAVRRAFLEGVRRIEAQLKLRGAGVLETRQTIEFTGCEQVWAVDADAGKLKLWMCAIEESDALGRLFDIDVIGADGVKLSRPMQRERRCLICGGPVFACARSRAHTAEELSARTHAIIHECFAQRTVKRIAGCAEKALLYEVFTTPKPGLVDLENSGAHRDMDRFTFIDSACALRKYFEECARTGCESPTVCAEDIFAQLRIAGLNAEAAMMDATHGVNTHKGALFSLGILCAAAAGVSCGRYDAAALLARAAELGRPALADLNGMLQASTGGEAQFLSHGYTGVRGEAASGFASVQQFALPAFRKAMAQGCGINDAGLAALAALMSNVLDSNVIRRAGLEGQQRMMAEFASMDRIDHAALREINERYVQENISPGGCADLLAVVYFLHLLEEEQEYIFAEC